MKTVPAKAVTLAAHNVPNDELIRQVEFEFPNLTGTLLQLLTRFSECCCYNGTPGSCHPDFSDYENDVTVCPKCGTELELKDSE